MLAAARCITVSLTAAMMVKKQKPQNSAKPIKCRRDVNVSTNFKYYERQTCMEKKLEFIVFFRILASAHTESAVSIYNIQYNGYH